MHEGERFNSISHIIGAVAAVAGLAVLIVSASRQGDPWKIASFTIYGLSLVLLYSVSALYHSLRGKLKLVFQRLDHQAIYVLIVGSYTPFALVTLRDTCGWYILGIVSALGVLGMVVDSQPTSASGRRLLPLIIYLIMGWMALIVLGPLLRELPLSGFVLLLAGGLFYTVGVVFYVFDTRIRHFHGVWHLFVLAGSGSHFFSILFYVN